MTWQMYWKKPFQLRFIRERDYDASTGGITYNTLAIGPLQMRWMS